MYPVIDNNKLKVPDYVHFGPVNIKLESGQTANGFTITDANDVEILHVTPGGSLSVAGDATVSGTIKGTSPTQILEGVQWVDPNDRVLFEFFVKGLGGLGGDIHDAFLNTTILHNLTVSNVNYMEFAIFDHTNERPVLVLNEGAGGRASTFNRSVQVGKNLGGGPYDANYTLAQGLLYADCDTPATGADMIVEDDIENFGGQYAHENIIAGENMGIGDFTENAIGAGTNSLDKVLHIKNSNPGVVLEDTGGAMITLQAGIGNKFYIKDETGDNNDELFLIDNNNSILLPLSPMMTLGEGTSSHEFVILAENGAADASVMSFYETSYRNNGLEWTYDSAGNCMYWYDWTGGNKDTVPLLKVCRSRDSVLLENLELLERTSEPAEPFLELLYFGEQTESEKGMMGISS